MIKDAVLKDPAGNAAFRRYLMRWFDREKRALPWRGESDPYRILVSEIMLQQTRVAVVRERYPDFLRQFPTVQRLARAREQTVLAAWSGLGYYRRARSLHAAAKRVAVAGGFPQTSAGLRELPGVGRYTASAVASIAFAEPAPVVDGNVQRVLERFTGGRLRPEQSWKAAARLLDRKRPGDFNQAIMELGALICLPGTPSCEKCPVVRLCCSRGAGAARRQTSRRKAVLNYALVRRDGEVLLEQRPRETSLMPGMWELPSLRPGDARKQTPIFRLRHSITTTDYLVSVYAGNGRSRSRGRWVPLRSAERLPLTGLARKILDSVRRSDRTTRI